MCPIGLQIEADVSGLESDPRMSRVIRAGRRGHHARKVRRGGCCPDPPATRQAVDAGDGRGSGGPRPGSWFTSVIPHVLVPGLAAALKAACRAAGPGAESGRRAGETAGLAERHLHVLAQHAPGFTVHDIIVDASHVPSQRERDQLRRTATLLEAPVTFADVSRPGTALHDPAKLAATLEAVRSREAQSPTTIVPTVAPVSDAAPWQYARSPIERPTLGLIERPAPRQTERVSAVAMTAEGEGRASRPSSTR